MKNYENKKHTIAVSAIWYERYLECSRTQGTSHFTSSVWRFYHSLLDIDNEELAIKTKIKKYLEQTWRPKLQNETIKKLKRDCISPTDQNNIDLYHIEVEEELIVELFEHIIQTIQNSGVGWPVINTSDEAWDYKDAIQN